MSPVKPTKQRNPRSILIGVGCFALGTALIVALFVLAIPKLTESGKIEVKLGSDKFDAGFARNQAPAANTQPLLFPDVANGQRDIFVVHTGDDPLRGWQAFDARKPGQGRQCSLEWDGANRRFKDPCDNSVVPADGTGLPHYPVEITKDEHVVIDLKADQRGTTTTSAAPTSTSSSIIITGSTPR